MASSSIHRFTLFTLDKAKDYTIIQQIVYYAKSWFWSILNHINTADIDHQTWVQKILHQELVHELLCLFLPITEKFQRSSYCHVLGLPLHSVNHLRFPLLSAPLLIACWF